jgi:ABC-type polysaccharide/polyol phosphate export permease
MNYIIKEIFLRRNLIRELILKDLKVRYSRPVLGFFWVLLSPFLTVAVFYIVFSLILKVEIAEAPFVFYLMSAVFPWRFFQDSLICSATSLVDNKNLIRESNFPHYLIPFSIILTNIIIFLPSLAILITTSFILKGIGILTLLLPAVLAIHFIITLGLSIMFSIFYVKWRDIKYILEVVLLLLFYLTPAFYSFYLVKASFSPLLFKVYIYNPFTIILNLYRITLWKEFYSSIEKEIGLISLIFVPIIFAIAVLLLGIYLYRKNKTSINDYLPY